MDATVIDNHDDPVAAAISAELTLEATLAFIDGCTLDSDEEVAVDPTTQPQESRSRTTSHIISAAVASPPLNSRFFELMDAVDDESDSEYVSMEDALKMLDTCEIDDEATESNSGSSGIQKPSTKSSVVRQQQTKETQQKLSFTQVVRVVSPSGSSDSDGNNDATGADSSGTSTSSIKSTAGGARKPKQRAIAASAAAKTLKKREAGARPSATLRDTVKEPPAVVAEVATGTDAVAAETAVKPKKKRVRKQRQELLYLREKVVEMQQVLESLQKNDGHASETTSSTSSTTTAVSSPTSSFDPEAALTQQQSLSFSSNRRNNTDSQIDSAAWEALAEQQLRERKRAEQENRQLKATLEGQIKLVQSLERLLIGPNDIELPGSTSQSKRGRMHLGNTRIDDSAILFELKQELASAYSRFEKDFASSHLREMNGEFNDVQVKTTAEHGMHVEFAVSKVVRHSFEITRKGMWRFMSREGMKSQCFYYKELEEPTSNSIARDFGCKLERSHRDMDIHGKQVLKKIEQERRDVFLWAAVVQPVKFSDAPSRKGIRFRDRGWLVIQPMEESDGSASEYATVIKTFVTFTPDLDENVSAKSMAVGAITDLVIDSVEGNIHFCQDIVDQLILEEEWRSNHDVTIAV